MDRESAEKEILEIREKLHALIDRLCDLANVCYEEGPAKRFFNTTVGSLNVTTRTFNALKNAGYSTVRSVCRESPFELAKTRCFGKKSIADLRDVLVEYAEACGLDQSFLNTETEFFRSWGEWVRRS